MNFLNRAWHSVSEVQFLSTGPRVSRDYHYNSRENNVPDRLDYFPLEINVPVRGRACKGLADKVWGPAGLSPDAFGLEHDPA